jgi:hypothetical protein
MRPKDYEQASETHPTSPDRSRDLYEEVYRRLVIGDFAKSSFDRCSEFMKYYTTVGRLYKYLIYYSSLLLLCLGVVYWIGMILYALIKIQRMKQFWVELLNFKVKI